MSAKVGSQSARRPRRRRNAELATLAFALGVALAVLPASPAAAAGRPQSGHANLEGAIESLPGTTDWVGDWTVGTMTVHVGAATAVDQQEGGVAVGVTVRVRGSVEGDGSMTAAEVKVQAGGCGESGALTSSLFAVLRLTATVDAPAGAEGVVVTRHFTFADGSDRQDLKVGVEGLIPRIAYEVIVDTVSAGVITTNDDGEGHLFLSNAGVPGAGELPAALQPVEDLKQVSVNTPSEATVLTGDFADARRNSHDNPAPDYLAAAVLTSGLPGVVGIVPATIKDGEQELSVGVWGLAPGSDYGLVIDGTAAATLTASETGRIHAEFSSAPGEGETALPDALLPVSALLHADLLDQDGNLVASGDFRSVSSGAGLAVQRAVKRKLGR